MSNYIVHIFGMVAKRSVKYYGMDTKVGSIHTGTECVHVIIQNSKTIS